MKRGLLVVGVVLVAAAALLVGQRFISPNQAPTLLDDGTSGLVAASHAECSQPGKDVAIYLATGSPTTLDPQWASARADILSRPADARPGLIRAQADTVITQCDKQLDQQAAAQAQAQQQAQQAQQQAQLAQQQAATAAALTAKEKATCARVGGKWGSNCQISYKAVSDGQFYWYEVSFNASGDIVPGGPQNAAACAAYDQGYGNTSVWHADTEICSI